MSTRLSANLADSCPEPVAAPPAAKNERWAARFGQVITRRGVATIPQALFYYQGKLGLSAQEVWFVCCLLADKWDGDLPRTSLKKLVKDSGLSLCQLRRIRSGLERQNYLRVVESFDDKLGRLPNAYDLEGLFKELELLIVTEQAGPNAIQAEGVPAQLHSPSGDWSFVERYGRVLVGRGIATIPQALFTYQAALELTPQQMWFCCYILAHKWDSDYPYPSLSKMAERTGYDRGSIQDIKDALVRHGYLRLVRRSNPAGGQDSNGYDFSGLLTKINELIGNDEPAPVASGEHDTTGQPERSSRRRRGRRGSVELLRTSPEIAVEGGAPTPQGGGCIYTTGGERAHTTGGERIYTTRGGAPAPQRGGAPAPHEEESDQAESDQAESDQKVFAADSYPISTAEKADHTGVPRYSAWIAGVIMDYSREMGNLAQAQSSTTQALSIWQSSGLAEASFIDLLQQAKATTRQYQGKQAQGTIANRMGYLFTVLRSLLGPYDPELAAGEVTL